MKRMEKKLLVQHLKEQKNDGYLPYEMDVTLPEGVTGMHKLFIVFNSTGNTANYIANVKDMKGIKKLVQDNRQVLIVVHLQQVVQNVKVKLTWTPVTNDTDVFLWCRYLCW